MDLTKTFTLALEKRFLNRHNESETTNMPLNNISNQQLHQQTTPSYLSIAGPSTQEQGQSFFVSVTDIGQVLATAQSQVQTSCTVTSNENNEIEIASSTTKEVGNSHHVVAANTDQVVVFTPLPNQSSSANKQHPSSSNLDVPIEDISPVPKGHFISGQGKRKPKIRQSSLVLTSTPNMTEIKSRSEPKAPPTKRTRKVTKSLFEDNSEEELFSNNSQDEEEDCPCIYCNDLFSRSKPGENWLRCLNCSHWAHASCADIPKSTKSFICELCE
ncbi:hypothetical protein K1T71_006296 [Dendrolimus kikuchii]|uniref:Uncharacterized protein n=1 Tax=Dendrolimus kikuchii TaxID=765133 RepID=A0ACC1D3J5_9NEOP|nr:hypothetical protein K1T71_006296 [Dendrolimus kikuchii]